MKYKVGDKVIESDYNRGIIKEIEYQQDDCYILGIDWGDGNLVWAAPTWIEPDYRAMYEQKERVDQWMYNNNKTSCMKQVPEQLKHIQEETQSLKWEEWYLQLCKIYAVNDGVSLSAARRRVNVHAAREWYDEGFTPYGTFRENYSK